MFVIRPIESKDLPALLKIAEESGHGFTSLPVNKDLLAKKISRTEQAVAHVPNGKLEDHSYLFVMEELATGEIMGTSGVEAAVGLDDPFYHYRLSKVVHSSRELDVYNTVELLTLCNDFTGVSELCTLFLREPYRQGLNGRTLSKFRFLFMAQHRKRFAKTVIAEMRGVSDDKGHSPFWQWLQDSFFSLDFPTVDYLTGIGQKAFIAELMPQYPVYVSLLPKAAQDVIGQVHKNTLPALKMLQSEGFVSRGYVDIFDGGPTVEAELNHIRTIRNSDLVQVEISDSICGKDNIAVCNLSVANFRATLVQSELNQFENKIQIDQKTADALLVENGDTIRAVNLT